jgi:predicted permease
MQERIAQSPGVASAAYAFMGVLEGSGWGMGFTVEGYHPKNDEGAAAMCNAVSPGFFQTMGAPLLAGRDFDDRDDRAPRSDKGWPFRVGIVNETFVKRYFSGHNPIGRHIGFGEDPGTAMPIEIVGVARDTHYMSVREDLRPQVFVPALQSDIERLTFYVRSAGEPGQMMATLRATVAAVDASLPIYNVSSMEQRVGRSTANERLIASLSGVLSGMATLLAVIGLYGVLAYTVTRRTREIGIRMALGAMGSQVAGRILREASTLVGVGLLLGWAAAASLGRFVGSQLYGVKPADALTIVMAGLLLSAIAAVAALLPAHRAASISPMSALRDE